MYTRINSKDENVIEKALMTFRSGGLVVYPTETCYGIGADATNQKAVDKLLTYKTRREGKPISVAVSNMDMAGRYAIINETARNLYINFLPGPLTVVSKGKGVLANGIESEYGTLGIRIPNYPLVLEIVSKLDKPITSTSANVSYKGKPYSIDALLRDLPQKHHNLIDLIIDAGELPHNEASTVVDTTLNDIAVIREGQIAFSSKENSPSFSVRTSSPQDTQNFGSMVMLRYIDHLLEGPVVFALGGELGSGKTQFAKGLAKKLGIIRNVKSPTFSLINPYPFSRNDSERQFVHVDTWRLANTTEFEHLKLEQYLENPNVIVIEWADKFYAEISNMAKRKDVLFLKVHLEHIDEYHRKIEIEEIHTT